MSVAVSVPALMNFDVNHSLLVIQRQLYNKKPVLNYRNKKNRNENVSYSIAYSAPD